MFKAKQKIIFFSLLALAVGLLVLPQAALAQASLGLELGADTGLGTRDLKDLIVTVIRVLLGFLGIICVGGIMYGGYLLMTAGGNEEKNSQGKKVAVNATIGLAVILSAFLIVSFVFNLFSDVTGGGGSGQGDRGAGDGGLGGGGDAAFRVTGIQPRGQLSIRNIVAQVTFSQNINPALIGEDRALTNQNAIVVEKQNEAGNFEPVEGVLKISANNPKKVLFVPNSACPEPHQDLKCFSYDENNASLNRHRIRVRSEAEVAIRSVSNLAVSCLGNSCQAEFATGANIDLEAPTVNLTEAINRFNEHLALRNGLPFIIDEAYQLLALATDDSGVAGIDFYVNEEFLDSQLPDNDPPREFLGQVDWSTQGLAPGRYVLAARSYDLTDRQSELSQVRVVVRPVHCFNNRQDEDLGETGLDCGGVCGACPGDLCGPVEENVCREPNNELCASGVCSAQNCRCLTAPVITQISPEAGAVGNFITIFGRNFGNTEGQVLIGDVRANLPHNNFCNGSWQDEQLIVELPQGLAVGNRQVRVITSDNLRSNNYDFSVNEETRPSLCLAVPVYGVVGGGFNLLGKNFGNQEQERSVYFGNGENFPAAEQAWNQLGNGIERASGLVPNIREGQTTVRVQLAGRSSNSLRFTVLLPNALLRLIDFNPKIGQAGQYVKISGQGFGDYQAQVSKVFFSGSVEGSFDFPQECLADNNFWTDSEILVKVPEGAQDGPLTVVVGERRVQSEVDFDYNSEAGLAPGLCSLHPQEGRVGSTFDLAGEYFTDATVKLGEQELVDQPFDDRHFNAVTVPEGARSGPVTVVRGDLQSNGLDFIVLQGRTMPPALPRDYYQWQFTTCDDCLVPEVVESATCGQDLASPSPVKNSRNAFRDTVISATFNVDMNNDLFQANQTVLLESCGQENSPAANCQAVNFAGQFAFGHTGGNSEYFTLILNDNLNLNTWYKVTLRDLRSTRENLALAEPYIWKFKTRVEDARCQIDQVRVTPNQKTLQNNDPVYLGERVNYRAQGFNAQNCNICPDRFSWAWSSSDQNNATIDDRSRIAQSLLVASGVTRQTATITATGSNNQGQSQAGTASVDIVPPRPRLIFEEQCSENLQSPSPYPGRQNACLNGKIAVRFSQVMSESLLNPAILTLSELPSLNQVDLNLDRGIYYEEGGQNGLRGAIFTRTLRFDARAVQQRPTPASRTPAIQAETSPAPSPPSNPISAETGTGA